MLLVACSNETETPENEQQSTVDMEQVSNETNDCQEEQIESDGLIVEDSFESEEIVPSQIIFDDNEQIVSYEVMFAFNESDTSNKEAIDVYVVSESFSNINMTTIVRPDSI